MSEYVYVIYRGEVEGMYGLWYMTHRQTWTKDKHMARRYNRNEGELLASTHNAQVIEARW